MGWFDEQIKMRKLSDQELLEDSFMRAASVVLGTRMGSRLEDKTLLSKAAIDDILKYYHIRPGEVKEEIEDFDERLEYVLRPHGIMRRNIRLKEGWYRDAFGPILGFMAKDDTPVALLPDRLFGYSFIDPDTGKKTDITKKNASLLSEDGICFYRPLPLKKLGIPDLIVYIKDSIFFEDILIMALSTLLVSVLGLLPARLAKALTGPVLHSGNASLLVSMAIFTVSTSLSLLLFRSSHSIITGRVNTKVSLAVEAAVMARVLSLPARFFRNYPSGELSSRANSIKLLCDMLMNFVFSLGLTSLSSLLYINQIFSFTPALVIPSLIIIAASIALSVASSLMQIRISKEQMELSAKGQGLSYALVSGIRKIKLAGAEKRAFSRWLDQYAKESRYAYDPPFFLKVNSVISLAVTLFGSILLYFLAVRNGIAQENYFAFSASYGSLMGALSSLANIALSFARIRPILEMAEPILNEVPELAENKEILTSVRGNIEINNVSFRYDEESPYIIDDLSLKIKAGEYIAIVGRTGCGKSTLMRLLLGFEKPEKGAIYYDGRDLETIDLKSLRRKIGTVMQSGALFQGSIYENIAISAPSLTLDEAFEAAEVAGIAEDIRSMPMGMHTLISEDQGGISGGQKQRLMIARAIAPKPRILFFDEATSALDNKTQRQVSEALDKLDCTRIIIAHRLSTIRNCDRILVLENGKIIEEGNYEELVKKNGFFAELVERQRLDTDKEEKKAE